MTSEEVGKSCWAQILRSGLELTDLQTQAVYQKGIAWSQAKEKQYEAECELAVTLGAPIPERKSLVMPNFVTAVLDGPPLTGPAPPAPPPKQAANTRAAAPPPSSSSATTPQGLHRPHDEPLAPPTKEKVINPAAATTASVPPATTATGSDGPSTTGETTKKPFIPSRPQRPVPVPQDWSSNEDLLASSSSGTHGAAARAASQTVAPSKCTWAVAPGFPSRRPGRGLFPAPWSGFIKKTVNHVSKI